MMTAPQALRLGPDAQPLGATYTPGRDTRHTNAANSAETAARAKLLLIQNVSTAGRPVHCSQPPSVVLS